LFRIAKRGGDVVDDTATLSQRRVAEDDGQPSILMRHLLGFAVLLVTVIPAYLATRPGGVPTLTSEAEAETEAEAAALSAAVANDESEEEPAAPGAPAAPAEPTKPRMTMADIHAHIRQVALRHGISPLLVAAIIEAESEFNPRAVSRRGARGLMQLMPDTAKTLGVDDPFDPRENIEAGVRHLRALMDRFGDNLPLVLAAYNAGEVAVIKHRGVPPYRETRAYVKRIMKKLDRAA